MERSHVVGRVKLDQACAGGSGTRCEGFGRRPDRRRAEDEADRGDGIRRLATLEERDLTVCDRQPLEQRKHSRGLEPDVRDPHVTAVVDDERAPRATGLATPIAQPPTACRRPYDGRRKRCRRGLGRDDRHESTLERRQA